VSCDRCDNPAVIHVTEPADGRNVERRLCEGCALKEGVAAVTIPDGILLDKQWQTETGTRIQARETVIWKTKGAGD